MYIFYVLFIIFFPIKIFALPSINSVEKGDVHLKVSNKNLEVVSNSSRAVLNWTNFDLMHDESISFQGPTQNSLFINQINDYKFSNIDGKINANNSLILLNKHGFIFGENSVVNAQNIVISASTLIKDIPESNYLELLNGQGSVLNYGLLSANGFISIFSNGINQSGKMIVEYGEVNLINNNFKYIGDGVINFSINDHMFKQIQDSRTKSEPSSFKQLTADEIIPLINHAVNIDKSEIATIIKKDIDGNILLLNDEINIDGEIIAPGNLSKVTVIGEKVFLNSGSVINTSGSLRERSILLGNKTTSQIEMDSDSNLLSSNFTYGGRIEINGQNITLNGNINLESSEHKGGSLYLNGSNINIKKSLGLEGKTGNGKIYINHLNNTTHLKHKKDSNDSNVIDASWINSQIKYSDIKISNYEGNIILFSGLEVEKNSSLTLSAQNIHLHNTIDVNSEGILNIYAHNHVGSSKKIFSSDSAHINNNNGNVNIYYLPTSFPMGFNFNSNITGDYIGYMMIMNEDMLNNIRNNLHGSYALMTDMNFKNMNWEPIQTFKGKINGRNKKIKNFFITMNDLEVSKAQSNPSYTIDEHECLVMQKEMIPLGVFANLSQAQIINLVIENGNVISGDLFSSGVLSGQINDSILSNITIKESYVYTGSNCISGLLAGEIINSSLHNISTEGDVSNKHECITGGIAGILSKSKIEMGFSNANISSMDSFLDLYSSIGGSYGVTHKCNITNVDSYGNINAGQGEIIIGGICGSNYSSNINKANCEMNIYAGDYNIVGGTIGSNNGNCIISNMYNSSNIYSQNFNKVGGFIGVNSTNETSGILIDNIITTGTIALTKFSKAGGVYFSKRGHIISSNILSTTVINHNGTDKAGFIYENYNGIFQPPVLYNSEYAGTSISYKINHNSKTVKNISTRSKKSLKSLQPFNENWDQTSDFIILKSMLPNMSSMGYYEVRNGMQMKCMERFPNSKFTIKRDITIDDLNHSIYSAKISFKSIDFTGIMDGNNKIIEGLNIPLFNSIINSEIKNLKLASTHLKESKKYIGLLARSAHNSTVRNCYIDGEITSHSNSNIGIIFGSANNSSIVNSKASGRINTMYKSTIGGLIGVSSNNYVKDSYSQFLLESSNSFIGGIMGISEGGDHIEQTYSVFNMNKNENNIIGGIISQGNLATISKVRWNSRNMDVTAINKGNYNLSSNSQAIRDEDIYNKEMFPWSIDSTNSLWIYAGIPRLPIEHTLQIDNVKSLQLIKLFPEKKYHINGDIDASSTNMWISGFSSIQSFEGIIYGNNKKISNLYITNGLFGKVKNARIFDLDLDGVLDIKTKGNNVGLISYDTENSIFENIHLNAKIKSIGKNNISGFIYNIKENARVNKLSINIHADIKPTDTYAPLAIKQNGYINQASISSRVNSLEHFNQSYGLFLENSKHGLIQNISLHGNHNNNLFASNDGMISEALISIEDPLFSTFSQSTLANLKTNMRNIYFSIPDKYKYKKLLKPHVNLNIIDSKDLYSADMIARYKLDFEKIWGVAKGKEPFLRKDFFILNIDVEPNTKATLSSSYFSDKKIETSTTFIVPKIQSQHILSVSIESNNDNRIGHYICKHDGVSNVRLKPILNLNTIKNECYYLSTTDLMNSKLVVKNKELRLNPHGDSLNLSLSLPTVFEGNAMFSNVNSTTSLLISSSLRLTDNVNTISSPIIHTDGKLLAYNKNIIINAKKAELSIYPHNNNVFSSITFDIDDLSLSGQIHTRESIKMPNFTLNGDLKIVSDEHVSFQTIEGNYNLDINSMGKLKLQGNIGEISPIKHLHIDSSNNILIHKKTGNFKILSKGNVNKRVLINSEMIELRAKELVLESNLEMSSSTSLILPTIIGGSSLLMKGQAAIFLSPIHIKTLTLNSEKTIFKENILLDENLYINSLLSNMNEESDVTLVSNKLEISPMYTHYQVKKIKKSMFYKKYRFITLLDMAINKDYMSSIIPTGKMKLKNKEDKFMSFAKIRHMSTIRKSELRKLISNE